MSKTKKELEEEVELLSTMLESLVQLLEEKKILTQTEWERKIKGNIRI
jgi:hypothetical protein